MTVLWALWALLPLDPALWALWALLPLDLAL